MPHFTLHLQLPTSGRKSSTYGLDIRNMSIAVDNNKSTASSAWRHEKLIEILDLVSWPS
jgi:hypothetical protein